MVKRPLVIILSLAASFGGVLAGSSAAQAAQRLESFALPSPAGNIDLTKVKLNKGATELRATALLPDGYDEDPGRSWPVLYLLHGGEDNSETWTRPGNGDIQNTAAGFPGIVVMPEGGSGSFVDWWQGGARSGPRWTSYYLNEVLPAVEARYRVKAGRQNHAIAGLSMGAYGAMFLGGQLPGYFGTIVSMSGLLDTQKPDSLVSTQLATGQSYDTQMGPILGPYASVHNPVKTVSNVKDSRVYLAVGNGIADPTVKGDLAAWVIGGVLEARLLQANLQYVATARLAGASPTLKLRGGVHDWPYWRRELPKAIEWGLFRTPGVASSAEARDWRYRTMEPAGNAWGLGYRFAEPTTRIAIFERDGQKLTVSGEGTVTITPGAADADASGNGTRTDCRFTATLPFKRTLPAGC
ncbi:MAG: alpha/beta hydrolase family protein [Solirubrobacteraceae bacterium]|nr:alpha/beta hydrolase family protein [Solirubrobacteraceae bacterium]